MWEMCNFPNSTDPYSIVWFEVDEKVWDACHAAGLPCAAHSYGTRGGLVGDVAALDEMPVALNALIRRGSVRGKSRDLLLPVWLHTLVIRRCFVRGEIDKQFLKSIFSHRAAFEAADRVGGCLAVVKVAATMGLVWG